NDHQASSPHVDVRDLLTRNVEVNRIEVVHILLIQVTAISQADSEPATRINLDTTKHINRIVIEGIRCMTADVGRRSDFSDRLEVLVHREVETDTGKELIRTIQ